MMNYEICVSILVIFIIGSFGLIFRLDGLKKIILNIFLSVVAISISLFVIAIIRFLGLDNTLNTIDTIFYNFLMGIFTFIVAIVLIFLHWLEFIRLKFGAWAAIVIMIVYSITMICTYSAKIIL